MNLKEIAYFGAIKKDVRICIIALPLNNSCPNKVSPNQGLNCLGIRFSLILMFPVDEAIVGSIVSITNNQLLSFSPKLELGEAKLIIKNRGHSSLQNGHKRFIL